MSACIEALPATHAKRRGPALLARIALAWRAVVTRRQLAEMDDRMLSDIGISRADALNEAARAPWDIAPRA